MSLMTILASCKSHNAMNFESNTKNEIMDFIDENAGQVVSISVVDAKKYSPISFWDVKYRKSP